MKLMSETKYPSEQIGKLAVLDDKDEDCTVYVICEFVVEKNEVHLVELDRPSDGEYLELDVIKNNVYLLEPIDVLERVKEWK